MCHRRLRKLCNQFIQLTVGLFTFSQRLCCHRCPSFVATPSKNVFHESEILKNLKRNLLLGENNNNFEPVFLEKFFLLFTNQLLSPSDRSFFCFNTNFDFCDGHDDGRRARARKPERQLHERARVLALLHPGSDRSSPDPPLRSHRRLHRSLGLDLHQRRTQCHLLLDLSLDQVHALADLRSR